MTHPTVLREALLDPDLLDALPGLSAALARNGHDGDDDSPADDFAHELRHRATPAQPRPPEAAANEGGTMPTDTSDDQQHRRARIERVEDEATAARTRVRLEEDQRVQESLRLAGYDAPLSERTRPATPRVSD